MQTADWWFVFVVVAAHAIINFAAIHTADPLRVRMIGFSSSILVAAIFIVYGAIKGLS